MRRYGRATACDESHPVSRGRAYGYCATVINGAVHSKFILRKDQLTHSSGKNDCQPRFQLSACEEVLVRSMKLRLL